jgi:hypothetical protein
MTTAASPTPPVYVCRCGATVAYELGKYGCPNCEGEHAPARLRLTFTANVGRVQEDAVVYEAPAPGGEFARVRILYRPDLNRAEPWRILGDGIPLDVFKRRSFETVEDAAAAACNLVEQERSR